MEKQDKVFKIFTKELDAHRESENGGEKHFLRGVATGTSLDAEGDRMSGNALRSMESQIIGLTLHKDHIFSVDNTLGHFTNARIVSDESGDIRELWVEAELEPFDVNPDAKMVYEKVKSGTRLGFSVAGLLKGWEKLESNDGKGRFLITELELLSVDLVTVPAYRPSQGSLVAMDISANNEQSAHGYICKEIGNIIRETDQTQSIKAIIDELNAKISMLESTLDEIKSIALKSAPIENEEIMTRIERIEANIVEPPKSRGHLITREKDDPNTDSDCDAFERSTFRFF